VAQGRRPVTTPEGCAHAPGGAARQGGGRRARRGSLPSDLARALELDARFPDLGLGLVNGSVMALAERRGRQLTEADRQGLAPLLPPGVEHGVGVRPKLGDPPPRLIGGDASQSANRPEPVATQWIHGDGGLVTLSARCTAR
jgi:hypothetical protein